MYDHDHPSGYGGMIPVIRSSFEKGLVAKKIIRYVSWSVQSVSSLGFLQKRNDREEVMEMIMGPI